MTSDAADDDFLMTVQDVFDLRDRGSAVACRLESGTLRSGEMVEVWDGDQVVATAQATLGMVGYKPGTDARVTPILLQGVAHEVLKAGQTLRRPAARW